MLFDDTMLMRAEEVVDGQDVDGRVAPKTTRTIWKKYLMNPDFRLSVGVRDRPTNHQPTEPCRGVYFFI